MEFRGQLIRNLLRILTPEEIADLTTSSSGMKKVSLSLVLESDLIGKNYREVIEELQKEEAEEEDTEDGKAKILPFENEPEEEAPAFHIQAGQRVHSLIQEYNKVFKELDKKILGPKRFPKRSTSGNRKQTSMLILEQKAKLHSSYAKIKSKEVMSLYQKSSSAEVRKKSDDENDFSISSNQGLLVNKKQA